MKLLLICSFAALIYISSAANAPPALPKQLFQKDEAADVDKSNLVNKLEPSADLELPSRHLFQYSNEPNPGETIQSSGSEAGVGVDDKTGEDMETAGTVTIGRHSGRFFGAGAGLGLLSLNRHGHGNDHHHGHSPRHHSYGQWWPPYYPYQRYHNHHHRYRSPGIWIGG